MRRLHSSTGVLSVTILGEIIHERGRSVRLRISGFDCHSDLEQQCLKLIDGSGSHKY
jgi:ferredoxin-fold anticodon binding domain-containing protein